MDTFFKSVPIQQWAEDDRPREKLVLKGKSALSDAELIAILLGSGTSQLSAVDVARAILANAKNSLDVLAKMNVNELTKIKGIGPAKAITLVAAFELARRKKDSEILQFHKIQSTNDAYELMKPYLLDLSHEEFWVLHLNRANKVMHKSKISAGGYAGTVVDVRMVFKEALAFQAQGLIMVHNHPSGNAQPSEADISLTKKMVQAGKFLDIQVLDHLIFTNNAFYSFADHGAI
jgi:DNA repair protein RadC